MQIQVQDLKDYIYENDKLEEVLEELGLHHIQWNNNKAYITCGMPDGDNTHSTTIYNDSYLRVVAYTRDIKDKQGISDIISLVQFIKKCNFREAILWLGGIVGFSEEYYINSEDKSESIIKKVHEDNIELEEEELQPLDEIILRQYMPYPNQEFIDDNIDYYTQKEFEIGWDLSLDWNWFPRHRYSIPIRDELGTLVGVKGRRTSNTEFHGKIVDDIREREEPKYIYMYPCAKSKILYGLYKTKDYIKEKNEVIICESEKGVMQLWSNGYRNAVGIGGHSLSLFQMKRILQMNVDIVVAFDKDVSECTVVEECDKLSNNTNNIYYTLDTERFIR